MQNDRTTWHCWAQLLDRWKANEAVSFLLTALGPLSVVAAQLLYFSKPFLNPFMPVGHVQALADMLDDQDELKSLIAFIQEKEPR